MALSDQQMQVLQKYVKKYSSNDKDVIKDKDTGQTYKIINRTPGDPKSTDVTQAIAVAPMDKNGAVDYSQTAIVVAGTQPGNTASSVNAFKAAWDPSSNLSAQTQDIRNFYYSTNKKLQEIPNGYISNMSGFSQSAPPVAKVASEQQVPHVTNFDDWAAMGATDPDILWVVKALPHSYLTDSDIAYLNKHAHIYASSSKDLTFVDGGGGNIPYGKVRVAQGEEGINSPIGDHDTQFAKIKGNDLDIEWYIQHNQFCSGMTKAQVKKIAKKKAAETWWDWNDKAEVEKMLADYEKKYGKFASPKPATQKLSDFNADIQSYKTKLKSASGGKTISLRSELVKVVSQKAELQAQEYATTVNTLIEMEKTALETQIQEVSKAAYELGQSLSAWEIDLLLSEFSMTSCWDAEIEAQTLAEAALYQEKLVRFSETLSVAADKIIALDKESAQLFQ